MSAHPERVALIARLTAALEAGKTLYPQTTVVHRADLRALLEDKDASWFPDHACFTGDCAHQKANECIAALREDASALFGEAAS